MKLSSFKSPSEHHCPWESDSFFFWNPPFMFFTWVHLLLPWHVLAPWRGESGKMPLKPLPSGIICAWRNIRNAKEQEPGGRAGLGEVLWSAGVRGLCPHCRIPLSQILSAETVSQQIFNNTNNFPVFPNNVFWGGESTFCKYPVFCTEKTTPLKTVCWV